MANTVTLFWIPLPHRLAHGDEFFRGRGVDADGGIELRLGGTQFYRDRNSLNYLAGVRPEPGYQST